MTLWELTTQLAKEYGSHAQAAAAHGLTKGQWNKLRNWNVRPTQSTLEKLGIVEVRDYQLKETTHCKSP